MVNLITDRTKSDVLLGTEKGRYGFEDLNRVESAVAYLAPLVGVKLETKTDWGLPGVFSDEGWPTSSQMMRFLTNVTHLLDVLRLDMSLDMGLDIPLPGTMDNLDWEGANQIERALQIVYESVTGRTSILGKCVLGTMVLGKGVN